MSERLHLVRGSDGPPVLLLLGPEWGGREGLGPFRQL